MERLDKIISHMSGASRREVKEMVRRGRVTVNGVTADSAESKVDADAVICIDGKPLGVEEKTYLMLHKPGGILTATEDRKKKTVLDLLAPEYRNRGLAPVGRLDIDTEGLLLLTNDGELNHRLTSPKYHVDKVYEAVVEGALTAEDVEAFAAGIPLKDFTCLPAKLEILAQDRCLVTVQEGKFHQVKRMLQSRGKPVIFLKRWTMGPISLPVDLTKGDYRPLTKEEIETLRVVCHL